MFVTDDKLFTYVYETVRNAEYFTYTNFISCFRNTIINTTANGKGKTPVTKRVDASCKQSNLKPKGMV